MSRAMTYQSCQHCEWKQKHGRCLMEHKLDCSHVLAEITNRALTDEEVVKQIPIEAIVQAVRAHGFAGELRKTVITTI